MGAAASSATSVSPARHVEPARLAAASPAERLTLLDSSPLGLSHVEAEQRAALCGPNEPVQAEGSHVLRRFAENFTHTLALLLWFAAGLSFATGAPALGAAIVAVVAINGMFAFIQEYRAEQVLQSLRRNVAVQASVIREGSERRLSALDLVPGDRIRLAAGDIVPADCVLLEADNLSIDLSMLTGETLPVERSADCVPLSSSDVLDIPSLMPAGAGVVTGSGTAVIYATGSESTLANVAALVAGVRRGSSMLERQVGTLARVTVIIAVFAGTFTLILATLRTQLQFLTVLTFATGVIVALVPEGLLRC